jgi:transposase
MKGHLPAGQLRCPVNALTKETAMETKRIVSRIGLDCHRTFSVATARDAGCRVLWRQKLLHADREALRKKLSKWPAGTPVILEGTFGWGWMCDELTGCRLDPHLASSRKVAAWREARGMAKSNKIDADLLSELWGEQSRWWEVWLAPPAVRDQREWLRHRMGLVMMQTQIKNRIHATLHRHGIINDHSDLFGVAGRRMLSQLVDAEDSPLRPAGRQTLKGQLTLLGQVRRLVAQATREFRATLRKCELGRCLTSLPGVSWVLGYTILAEVGQFERFKNADHLVSYSLLAPIADDSGEDDGQAPIGRRLGHAGRQTLQWAWIEAARSAVRKSPRFRAIFNRRTDNGKRERGRGYITVANQLCRVGYAVGKKCVKYTEVPPPRPGSRATLQTSSRPGTGQPDVAMAAAAVVSPPRVSL